MFKNEKGENSKEVIHVPTKDDSTMIIYISYI